MLPDLIRIVVCGDESVGKSSLILSFTRESTTDSSITHVLPPITISRNDYEEVVREVPSVIQERDTNHVNRNSRDISDNYNQMNFIDILPYVPNTTTIVDTNSSDVSSLHKELKRADVICLVYSDHYTYERISLHWMPMLRSLGVNLPIILCANKSDLSPRSAWKNQDNEEFLPLINEFKEIEAGLRCSALNGYNIVEVFYICQRAIVYPISPLFDAIEHNLRPRAIEALKRVFFLFDADQDGYLSFDEFNELHKNASKRKLLGRISMTMSITFILKYCLTEKMMVSARMGSCYYTNSLPSQADMKQPGSYCVPIITPTRYHWMTSFFILIST